MEQMMNSGGGNPVRRSWTQDTNGEEELTLEHRSTRFRADTIYVCTCIGFVSKVSSRTKIPTYDCKKIGQVGYLNRFRNVFCLSCEFYSVNSPQLLSE